MKADPLQAVSPAFADNFWRDAQARPWRHSLLTLMRRMAAQRQDLPPIGLAQRPQLEPFRLGQQASLVFAPREIARVCMGDYGPSIKLFGLGMLGANGPLPIHFTEQVRERSEAKQDHTLANFLDMFHHRLFTHIYRAWAQSQSAAGLDRPDQETFTPYVARLAGDEASELQHSPLSPHARWASAAHRVRQARNPEGLVSTLSRYFGVPVQLQEYRLHWMQLDEPDQTRLGIPRPSSVLGQGALLGEQVPDRQSRFRLVIGPLDMDGYLRLTPQGSPSGADLPALIEWVRAFVGFEYLWDIEPLVQRGTAPSVVLGGEQRLAWSTWMGDPSAGSTPGEQAISGMVIEPEGYAHSIMPARAKPHTASTASEPAFGR